MRISDWSSDVCSSDLLAPSRLVEGSELKGRGDALAGLDRLQPERGRVSDLQQDSALALLAACGRCLQPGGEETQQIVALRDLVDPQLHLMRLAPNSQRSEEHTSEPQSLMRISYAVVCL